MRPLARYLFPPRNDWNFCLTVTREHWKTMSDEDKWEELLRFGDGKNGTVVLRCESRLEWLKRKLGERGF